MDRARPGGATVDLAPARHRATDPDRRIGSLPLDPGGPGMSGDLALSSPFSFSPDFGREATLRPYDGVGHLTYRRSACMRAATDTYPTTPQTPAKGTRCPANRPGDGGPRLRSEDGGLADPLSGPESALQP